MFKKKSLLDRFRENYTAVVVPCDNKDGFRIDYVYYGDWFMWDVPKEELKRYKRIILGECLGCIAAFILNAIVGSALNAFPFVAYPALLALCIFVFELVGVGQFYFAKYKTTRSTYEEANRRLRGCTVLYAVTSAVAAVGCVYYMIQLGASGAGIITVISYGIQAVLSLLIRRQYVQLPFSTERNNVLHHVERATIN